jgi:hypothetical protein
MQYDRFNRNLSELCHAVKCRKHKRLHAGFGGKFCQQHLNMLTSIRKNLHYAKCTENIYLEQYYRQQEIEFRKIPCVGHMHYQANLETHLLCL